MFYIFFMSLLLAPEAAMLLAAKLHGVGAAEITLAVAAISVGGTLGSSLIYLAARLVGGERCAQLLARRPWRSLCSPEDLCRIRRVYADWGGTVIFFGRWVPAFRSLVSIPAGLTAMDGWRFLYLTFLGTLSWNGILGVFIYLMGQQAAALESWVEGYTLLSLLALGLLLLYWLGSRLGVRLSRGPRG